MMTDSDFFGEGGEHDRLLGFSGNLIRSDVEARSEACVSAALDDIATRYVCVNENEILSWHDESSARVFMNAQELEQFEPDFASAVLAGWIDDTQIVGIRGKFDAETLCQPYSALTTRSLLYSPAIPVAQTSAAGMIVSLMHWHNTNQFCGRCGGVSKSRLGGMRRDCSVCDAQIFPRTDPAVIMLAIRGDKCLLGRGPHFPPNWYSCLAGFVEPGESIEQAVRRETREESNIKIGRVKYFASQPWPFPHSLMIGAYCEALSEKISFPGEELEDCRWFSRDEALSMVEKRHPQELRSPPSQSIASAILRNWLAKTT